MVPATADALAAIDPASREAAVTVYLTDARDRLALAVQATGPEAVAAIKAEIATAAEATKQLGLSKEIQTDAQEMVRRAEYAVRKSVTAAQHAGEVRVRNDNLVPGGRSGASHTSTEKPSPASFFATDDEYRDANAMAALPEDKFEDVLTEARGEGNLSRANVAEKAREAAGRTASRKPPRKALVEVAKTRGFALRAATDSLLKIFDDDRYRTNEKQVADALRGHLLYVAETVAAVLDQLP
jgi:hypothetical protein